MKRPCYVYVLMNPDNKRPFYIGISENPWDRFEAHRRDPCSSAWPAMRLLFDGRDLFQRDEVLKVYKRCRDRQSAIDVEFNLINSTPGLLNKARHHQRVAA